MNGLTLALFVVILFAALNTVQPHLTRPELFFALTVTREFRRSAIATKILRVYIAIGWAGTIVSVLLLLNGMHPVYMAALPLFLGWFGAYFVARHRTRPYRTAPTSLREVSLSPSPDRFPGGAAAAFGPFVILMAKTLYVHSHWNSIPERFPVHWGFHGPDRWAERSVSAVYSQLGWVALLCAFIVLAAYGAVHASRRVSVSGPAGESESKFRNASALSLLLLAYALATLLPSIQGATPEIPYAPAIILVIVAGMMAFLIWSGQGGTRLSEPQPEAGGPPVGDRTADEYWKAGMFYYNPADPAFLVEKRFGMGWTLNFGNRMSWVVVPILLLPVLLRWSGA